jgi:inorganic triphosphatase YgiF
VGSHIETERAFSPGVDATVPDLAGLTGVSTVEPAGEVELDATYFDTPAHVLLAAGVTLRRRVGGDDEGWHLKLPTGAPGSREEVHASLSDAPPEALLSLVDGWTRGIAPAPVARIRTRRTTARLVGADGDVLAEVSDDEVVAHVAQPGAEAVEWREWEVELVEGEPDLLDAVEDFLAARGVERSAVQRKIEMVLAPSVRPESRLDPATLQGPAKLLLHPYLVAQVRDIERLDPVVRRGGAGGVHGLRKACRRLRAVLAAYGPLLDRDQGEALRDELRWFARELSDARDHEVVRDHLEAMVAQQPEALVVGPVGQRLHRWSEDGFVLSRFTASELLSSSRYHDLRAALDEVVVAPRWTPEAEQPADSVLPPRIHREWRRVRRHRKEHHDPHELRKSAKRLRHAFEVLEPVWGDRATAPRKAAQQLTQLLGERQDSVAARAALLDLSRTAAAAGEDTFTYGRLHAEAERQEDELLAEARQAWRDLKTAVRGAGW